MVVSAEGEKFGVITGGLDKARECLPRVRAMGRSLIRAASRPIKYLFDPAIDLHELSGNQRLFSIRTGFEPRPWSTGVIPSHPSHKPFLTLSGKHVRLELVPPGSLGDASIRGKSHDRN